MKRIATVLAGVLVLLLGTPPAWAGSDGCAGWSDAGASYVEAFPIHRGITCSGHLDSNTDDHDWYFVDVAVTGLSSALSVQVCGSSDTVFMELYFLPAGSLVPWTGTSLTPDVDSTTLLLNYGPLDWLDYGFGDADCDTVSGSVGLTDPAAGGRWLLHLNVNYGTSYSLSAW